LSFNTFSKTGSGFCANAAQAAKAPATIAILAARRVMDLRPVIGYSSAEVWSAACNHQQTTYL